MLTLNRKRIYVLVSIILALVLLGGTLFLWDLLRDSGKQQDKVYSGAKLVYIDRQISKSNFRI